MPNAAFVITVSSSGSRAHSVSFSVFNLVLDELKSAADGNLTASRQVSDGRIVTDMVSPFVVVFIILLSVKYLSASLNVVRGRAVSSFTLRRDVIRFAGRRASFHSPAKV